jgi:lipopolysaccharide transport system ATP-binding protein
MYVRLAFAVAAHLDPEILLVDEVLAVGDARFQARCLGKMHEVSRSGRTVFFVSHSMSAIKALCTKVILLDGGQVKASGNAEAVVRHYLAENVSSDLNKFNRNRRVGRSEECWIVDAWLSSGENRVEPVSWDKPFEINVIFEVRKPVQLSPEYIIRDAHQCPILFAPTGVYQGFQKVLEPGTYKMVSVQEGLRLAAGRYHLDLILQERNVRAYDHCESALTFEVAEQEIPPLNWKFRQNRGQGVLPFSVETTIERHQAD